MNAAPTRSETALVTACAALIVFGAVPVVLSWPSSPSAGFFSDLPRLQWLGYAVLGAGIVAAIVAIARLDAERGPAKVIRYIGFISIAALLTDLHYYTVDIVHIGWQIEQYKAIFAHTAQAPDQYRFLPQGVLWWMTLCNGDFGVSYLAYRFFFTFLLCQAIYQFARCYLAPRDAVLIVLVYGVFYPLSIRYYFGNMLDPMSHAMMIAALTYCRRRRLWCVFALMAAGSCVKETMMVVAPCYWLLGLDEPERRAGRDAAYALALGAVGAAAFLLCRVPFHFDGSFQMLNRTLEPMVYSNLGMARGLTQSTVSVFQRYLHPILFVFMWIPFVVWRRATISRPLFYTAIYVSLAIYVTNLFFGWNYESRNFVPGLVALVVAAVAGVNAMLEPRPTS